MGNPSRSGQRGLLPQHFPNPFGWLASEFGTGIANGEIMHERLQRWIRRMLGQTEPQWRLMGLDVFAGEYFPIPGVYATREEAQAAADEWERKIAEGPASPELRDKAYVLPPGTKIPD